MAKIAPATTTTTCTAAQAAAEQSTSTVKSFTVSDTAANIAAYFSSLNTDTKLTGITVTDGKPLPITYAQYTTDTFVMGLLPAGTTFILGAVPVANAATIQAATAVTSFAVTDTAANVLTGLATLATDTKLTAITLGGGTTLAVTYTQYTTYAKLLALLAAADTLTVSGVIMANAATLQAATKVSAFAVTDTTANILTNLATLATATKLSSLTLSGATSLAVTYTQYQSATAALDKLVTGDTMVVAAATAAATATLQADAHVAAFAVTDTGANIAANLATLSTATKLTAIALSSGTTVPVTYSQYTTYTKTLALIAAPATMAVSAVTVANAATMQSATRVSAFAISDTSANVLAGLATLSIETKLTGITLTGGTTVAVTLAQYTTYATTLGLLTTADSATVSGGAVANAATLQGAAKVSAFTVTDTTANILAGLTTLATDTKISTLTLSGATTLAVTGAQYVSAITTLDKLATADTMTVSAAAAASAAALQADSRVTSFSITDTGADVTANAGGLVGATKLSTITLTGGTSVTVTYAQYQAATAALDKLAAGDTIIVTGVSTAGVAAVVADTHVGSLTVSDSLANIGTSLSSLETLVTSGKVTGIAVADSGQNLAITAAQSTSDKAALALMTGTFSVTRPVINLIWDASVANAPAGFISAVEDAANYFDALITSPITVNIDIGYGEYDGITMPSGGLGETAILSSANITTAQFTTDLGTVSTSSTTQSALANLAVAGEPATVAVAAGEAKALGALPAYGTEVDAAVGFALDPTGRMFTYNPNNRGILGQVDFIAVAEHELSHALGRVNLGAATSLDLFRYSAPGVLAAPGATSYFSVNGGVTNLDNFATSGDYADWAASAGYDANDALLNTGYESLFTQADVTEMAALGFAINPNAPSSAATIPASAAGGLNAASLTFIGTPITLTMGGTTTTATVAIPPAAGIEEIAGFTYGTDVVTLNLSDLSGSLEAFDTTVGGVHAVALAGSNDLTNGVVLTGMLATNTAANLVASHLHITGSTATIT